MDELVKALLLMLHDTEEKLRIDAARGHYRSDALADFLHDFRLKRVIPLYTRLERMKRDPYVVSLVGLTNVGKSTLAHALLGHPVAPRRNGPATAIPVEYAYGPKWAIRTLNRETMVPQDEPFSSPDALAAELRKRVFDLADNDSAKVVEVCVYGPMELLEGGLVFMDMPGFGAAETDATADGDLAKLAARIREHGVHEVLFCVSGANHTVTSEEVKFFDAVKDLCSTVIITKWDPEPEEHQAEMECYKATFKRLFPMQGFMFVEAKWAINGMEKESNLEELRELIRRMALAGKRPLTLIPPLVSAWDDLQLLVRKPLRQTGLQQVPWRENAIHRFRRVAYQFHPSFKDLP